MYLGVFLQKGLPVMMYFDVSQFIPLFSTSYRAVNWTLRVESSRLKPQHLVGKDDTNGHSYAQKTLVRVVSIKSFEIIWESKRIYSKHS